MEEYRAASAGLPDQERPAGLNGHLDRIHEGALALAGHPRALQDVGESGRVEDRGSGVAHIFHEQANSASALVAALRAFFVGGFADAGQRRQRTFEHPQDQPDGQQVGRLAQRITATLALLAAQHSMILQFQQDQFEKALGDMLTLGDFGDEQRAIPVLFAQDEQRLEGVFRFVREHPIDYIV